MGDLKYIISSDTKYFYFLDKDFKRVAGIPPVYKSAVINYNAPLDTVVIDPWDGTKFWATTEYKTPDNQLYSFNYIDGVVSNVVGHLIPALGEVESICFNPGGELVLLSDSPNQLTFLDGNFQQLRTLDLAQFGLVSPQGVCYVPWLDAYLISDNNLNKLMVISETLGILDEINVDRLGDQVLGCPVPANCQAVGIDYKTKNIFLTSYQPSDWVYELTFGGKLVNAWHNSEWLETHDPTYANPTSIHIMQDPFRS